MNTNDRNQTLRWAFLAGVLVALGAADLAWPYWLAWLANVAVIQGSSLAVCLYKRNVLAWAAFGVLAAVSLANAALYVLGQSPSDVNLGLLVTAAAFFGSWHYLFTARTVRPEPVKVPEVVMHHHVHHGLPGTAAPAWAASEAFPVVSGTAERPPLGRRRNALTPGSSNSSPQGAAGSQHARRHRVLEAIDRITGGAS